MSWRVVYISGRAKLDLKLNHLVIRKEEITRVHISEIYLIVIDSLNISITTALISELIKRKIKIILCDEDHNPQTELIGLYNKHDSVKCLKHQINWDKNLKLILWRDIVAKKIQCQSKVLYHLGLETYDVLKGYAEDIEIGDKTNREGHAAKVYFNSIFGNDFSRKQNNNINAALNYGYALILSIINREVAINGYNTQLGIFHDNQFNHFNLSCDLMEPLRPMIDNKVLSMDLSKFESKQKKELISLLNDKVKIDGKNCRFDVAISKYCKSIFEILNIGEYSEIKFINYEL